MSSPAHIGKLTARLAEFERLHGLLQNQTDQLSESACSRLIRLKEIQQEVARDYLLLWNRVRALEQKIATLGLPRHMQKVERRSK